MRQIVNHGQEHAEEINNVARVLCCRAFLSRRWMRAVVSERPHFVRPFLHDGRQQSLFGEVVNLLSKSFVLPNGPDAGEILIKQWPFSGAIIVSHDRPFDDAWSSNPDSG